MNKLPPDRLLLRIALLGAATGLMAGVLVTLFRFSIEISQTYLLPDGQIGNYEALPGWLRFLLPVLGAVVLGFFFEQLPASKRSVGIVHLLNYMSFRKQALSFSNAVVQFFGGLIAIVSGHSVDREGPGVHLGAVLRAPLAALVALMELTGNLNIILPGMIVVVTAEIATRTLIGDVSAFTAMLKLQHKREAEQNARND